MSRSPIIKENSEEVQIYEGNKIFYGQMEVKQYINRDTKIKELKIKYTDINV